MISLYDLRVDLIEWASHRYEKYKLREYVTLFDFSLFLWYIFLYLVMSVLGWFSWFWRLIFIAAAVVNNSMMEATDRRLQLRHALAIAKDEDLRRLLQDINQKTQNFPVTAWKENNQLSSPNDIFNIIIKTAWPYIDTYIRVLVSQIESDLQHSMSETVVSDTLGISAKQLVGMKIQKLKLGEIRPSITDVVVRQSDQRIALDLSVQFITGDDFQVEITAQELMVAGLSKLQFTGTVRLDAGPLIPQPPFVESLSIHFLETPFLDFAASGLIKVDALRKYILDTIIESIKPIMVYPNSIICPMIGDNMLRAPQPFGVILLRVDRAEKLKNADMIGKSDPYCLVSLGSSTVKSETINDNLNPVWNFVTMMVVKSDPNLGGQFINFVVKDYDKVDADDELLKSRISIRKIFDKKTILNQRLENELMDDNSSLYISAVWLTLSEQYGHVKEVSRMLKSYDKYGEGSKSTETTCHFTAVLMVWLIGAENISPSDVDYYAQLHLDETKKSISTSRTPDTHTWRWMQDFTFCVKDPNKDSLKISIIESGRECVRGEVVISLKEELLTSPSYETEQKFKLNNSSSDAAVKLGLKMRFIDPGNHSQNIFETSKTQSNRPLPLAVKRGKKVDPLWIPQELYSTNLPPRPRSISNEERQHNKDKFDHRKQMAKSTTDIANISRMAQYRNSASVASLPAECSESKILRNSGRNVRINPELDEFQQSNSRQKRKSIFSILNVMKLKRKRKVNKTN